MSRALRLRRTVRWVFWTPVMGVALIPWVAFILDK